MFPLQIRNERQLLAMTGTNMIQFQEIENEFEVTLNNERQKLYEIELKAGNRKRNLGGGRKGTLSTVTFKLFFTLYYLKNYVTFDVLGSTFGISRSKACENLHHLTTILGTTLNNMGYMPHREFKTTDDFIESIKNIDTILIDATERPVQRPTDEDKQSQHYSGKRKDHTFKNTVMCTKDKIIHFIGKTFCGSMHDFCIFKEEFDPMKNWFEQVNVFVDLGYTGINKAYGGENINVPCRMPAKTKNNPNPQLDEAQKQRNNMIGKIRILVENALAGLKRFRILVHDFRNRVKNFEDETITICAGLWNMMRRCSV
jgi:hypothetical protein